MIVPAERRRCRGDPQRDTMLVCLGLPDDYFAAGLASVEDLCHIDQVALKEDIRHLGKKNENTPGSVLFFVRLSTPFHGDAPLGTVVKVHSALEDGGGRKEGMIVCTDPLVMCTRPFRSYVPLLHQNWERVGWTGDYEPLADSVKARIVDYLNSR